MEIQMDLVKKVANLAKLGLSEEELKYFQSQMKSILEFFSMLEEMPDPFGTDFRTDILAQATVEREDCGKSSLPIEAILESAPAASGSFFQVPRNFE